MFADVQWRDQVRTLDTLLRTTFASWQLIDFDSGFEDSTLLQPDGFHLNDRGQRLRADRAIATFRR